VDFSFASIMETGSEKRKTSTAYFNSLKIKNFVCKKPPVRIDLTDKENKKMQKKEDYRKPVIKTTEKVPESHGCSKCRNRTHMHEG
jgi:hypothetical protein